MEGLFPMMDLLPMVDPFHMVEPKPLEEPILEKPIVISFIC